MLHTAQANKAYLEPSLENFGFLKKIFWQFVTNAILSPYVLHYLKGNDI